MNNTKILGENTNQNFIDIGASANANIGGNNKIFAVENLNGTTTGSNSIITGSNSITTGSNGIYVGHGALSGITTGSNSVPIGYNTSSNIISGSNSVPIGYGASSNIISGSNCNAIGYNTLGNNPWNTNNEKDKTDKLVKALEELINTQKEYIQTQKQHIDDLIHDKMILSKLLDTKNCTFEEKMNVFENLKG